MIDKETVQAIVDKYDKNYVVLSENATHKEFNTVLKYIATEANRKQRKTAGLS
jgi:hypothetical protein